MSHDIYAGLSGAAATWAQLEVLADNIANSNTTGFKAGRVTFEVTGPDEQYGDVYAQVSQVQRDRRDGPVIQDGVSTHLALRGRGFFAMEDSGRTLLTRDGRFTLSEAGELVTLDGQPVLGQGGPILVPPGETLRIAQDGTVYGSDSGEIDRLRVLDAEVEPVGANAWTPLGPTVEIEEPHVLQGALEGSNTDPMRAMVELIEASRYFQAYQKAMQASDEADQTLNQTVGRS